MNATATLPPDVAAYLDQVRAALADVPAEERDEMLADLEVSLLEGAAEDAAPPEVRLGPPDRFAQELRAAAGIAAPAPGTARKRGLRDRLRDFAATPRGRSALATARELAPVWWVARGYVAACALALAGGQDWSDRWPLLPVQGFAPFGAMLVLAGVAASVWLGLKVRREGRRRRWLTVLNVGLAALALPIGAQALNGPSLQFVEVYTEAPPTGHGGLHVNGAPVLNVYPYDRDGKLLLDVLLYDHLGQPLEVGSADPKQDPLRRYLFTRGGQPVLNSFPIRYVEPGSTKVAEPAAAPHDIQVPKIQTPPLKVKRP